MADQIDRDLGDQPIARIMKLEGIKAHDLVEGSTEQITHKMVSRAVKGRRLTPNVQRKILNAINNVSKNEYLLKDLFTY